MFCKIVKLDSIKVDSLIKTVGLGKVFLLKGKIIKQNPNTYLDFNAIAKGYGVDVIAEFLEHKNVKNYAFLTKKIDWSKVDFKQYSLVFNHQSIHDFSIQSFVPK